MFMFLFEDKILAGFTHTDTEREMAVTKTANKITKVDKTDGDNDLD